MQECTYEPNPGGVIEVTQTTICWFTNTCHHIGWSFRVGAQFSYIDQLHRLSTALSCISILLK